MKKVLVVAEKPFFIDLLAEHGAVTGLFGVLNAENSGKAIAILESILIDVVVTDLELPDVDGFELLLSVSQRFPNLPIVALTSASQRELRARVETSAAVRFHSKPVNLEVLINEVCDSMDAVAANQRATSIELGTTLQLLEACRRTCMVRVKVGDSPAGFCFMRDGVLFQAFTPTTKGEEALQQLVRATGVNLGFARIPDKNIPRGIELDVTTLLRRAGVLKRFEEDELDALAGANTPPPVQKTARFQPVPGAIEEEDEVFPAVPAIGRRNTRRTTGQPTPPKKLTTGRRSAFEQWQETTASRRAPAGMPTQPFMEVEADDEDDLLEVLGAPAVEPMAPGPYVRGRARADAPQSAGVYLPPEDSNVMYDVARGARPTTKPPSPPPLPKAPPPKMPPRVEIIHDEDDEAPPALAGVDHVTPLELMFDGPIELDMPPPPPNMGPIELDLDHLDLLEVPPPPPPPRGDYAPALLPPVPLPPVAFDLAGGPPPLLSDVAPVQPPAAAQEALALAPTEHAMPAVTAPLPPPPESPAALDVPQLGQPDGIAGSAEPTELISSAPAVARQPALSAKALRLVARALSAANDVVGLRGVALVSEKTGTLYSTFGPLAEHADVEPTLPELLGMAMKFCKAIDGGEASCLCIRCQEGRICYLPLRVLPSQLPARTNPATLGLVMFLAPDGETVLAFHRLRQAEMLLVETLQDSQEEALWLPLQ